MLLHITQLLHSQNTLLTQFVSNVSAFSFSACTKTCAPLSDCCINNALIHFVPRY